MPAFLVQIPSRLRVQDVDTMVIFAANEAGARAAAAGRFSGDAAAIWNTLATVTEIVAGTALADAGGDWTAWCRVSGGAAQTAGFDPFIVEVDGKSRNQAQGRLGAVRQHLTGTLNDGGVATYVVDDILTVAGGTAVRAATFRVTTVNTGVITGIELVDPGEYTVLPTLAANPVTGGGGSGALVDLSVLAENSYEALLAQMVTGLLGSPDIANAALDLSEAASGARLLTVASVADGIGDATVEFEVRNNGTAFAPLVSTITDGGIAAAALSVAIPASPLAPPRITVLKS